MVDLSIVMLPEGNILNLMNMGIFASTKWESTWIRRFGIFRFRENCWGGGWVPQF